MEEMFNWLAPIATTIAAVMVAANAGTKVTGYGFIAFSIGSIAWMAIGWYTDQTNLLVQNAILLAINILGIWRWLGLRRRYEKGAAVATERTMEGT
jgi:hypothetical protein